jgi:hypothetical protein
MNRLGEGFAGFLADEAGARGLPDFLPALARFEWTDFAVYTSMEPVPARVERLTVNPTLMMLEHPFRLCAFMRAGAPSGGGGDGRGGVGHPCRRGHPGGRRSRPGAVMALRASPGGSVGQNGRALFSQ